MIKLRPYQNDAIQVIHQNFLHKHRQYVEMPTGSGKTVTFLSYAKQYHKKILVLVPSIQLMNQVYETSLLFYSENEISRKGNRHNEKIKTLHICIINSLREKYFEDLAEWENFDLLIIDEAHRVYSNSYRNFISVHEDNFTPGTMKILGVTATPDRADGKILNDILYDCTFKLKVDEMIDAGYLCDIEGYSVKTKIDLSDIDDHNGDFSLQQLYKKLNIDNRNQMIVDLCKKDMKGRKSLIFCINVEHSKLINQKLNEIGLSSMHIDGQTDSKKRESILSSFRSGEIQFLCNCQLLTEGFDEPSIDGIILARPTRSRALFNQMIGRGLRIFPGKKNCKIIDICDNHRALAGFNSIISDNNFRIYEFKSLKELKQKVENQLLKINEFTLEKIDLFDNSSYKKMEALFCMKQELENRFIDFFEPISLEEAAFLLWYDLLKKEYYENKVTANLMEEYADL